MAKELARTLTVNSEEYNINAVHADVASSVKHSLTINKTNLEGTIAKTPLVTFDGSTDASVTIVPACGGRFTGKVRIADYPAGEAINQQAILNCKDIKTFIVNELKNNSVLAEWNWNVAEGTGTLIPGGSGASVKSISIITGKDDAKNHFAAQNNENYEAYVAGDASKAYLSAFIYISDDAGNIGNIYFGTCTESEVSGVQVNAENANTAGQLASPQRFSVSLSSDSVVDFDGTQDVALGVTGRLPVDKGGTGADNASEARVNLGIIPENIGAAAAEHSHNYAGSSSSGGAALQAIQDQSGHTIDAYYQPKILTGTDDPNTTNKTEIKNAPNGAIYIKY
jgi:hypothetical protein